MERDDGRKIRDVRPKTLHHHDHPQKEDRIHGAVFSDRDTGLILSTPLIVSCRTTIAPRLLPRIMSYTDMVKANAR